MTKQELIGRVYKKHLTTLVTQVEMHLAEIDKIMAIGESGHRGKKIAQSCNNLEMVKDTAKRFGLGA